MDESGKICGLYPDIDQARILPAFPQTDLEKILNISGTIRSISETDNFAIIEIEKPETMKVAIFKDKNISLNQGDEIQVIGKIEEYQGNLEIIGDKIIKKS